MSLGRGLIIGHLVTLRRFIRTFFVDTGRTLSRRGGGSFLVDLFQGPRRGEEPVIHQDASTEGLFTVEYPDERLPVRERFRVLPMLIYDDDGHVRCTSCNICAKVCPPQCIWMTHARGLDGKPVPMVEEFFIDMDVCMNCGLCAEYCPFDAIKMDQNFELSNYERHRTHVYSLQDLLVSSTYEGPVDRRGWSFPCLDGPRWRGVNLGRPVRIPPNVSGAAGPCRGRPRVAMVIALPGEREDR